MVSTSVEATQKVDVAIAGFHLIGLCGTIRLRTSQAPDIIDITEEIEHMVQDARIAMGLVLVFTKHTTTAVVINEKESGLDKDIAAFFERLAPKDDYYYHNDFSIRTENLVADESPNGHSHALNYVLGSSQWIPVTGGLMTLGTWQRIFLVELDHPRDREVMVQVWGVGGGNGHQRGG